jgi:hypothetical protein
VIPAVVMPDTVTLPLAYGWTVTVWAELTHGQHTDMQIRMFRDGGNGEIVRDLTKITDAAVMAYLVDWTLTDAQGQRIEIRGLKPDALQDVLRNLRQFAAGEVKQAIEAHHERQQAALADLKKTASTETPSATTSPYAGSRA